MIVRLPVALLAEEGPRGHQQLVLVGPVRCVAVGAVLAHRRMLPQERTALLGMAGEAELIDRLGTEHRLARRTMRVVTVVAGHFAFRQGHMRLAAKFIALLNVTALANLIHIDPGKKTGLGLTSHRIVAIAARNLIQRMQ